MARQSGNLFLLKRGTSPGTTIGLQSECSLNVSVEPVDATTKTDTNGFFLQGKGSWTVDFSGVYDTADATLDTVFTNIDTKVVDTVYVDVGGGEVFSGAAFLTSFALEGGTDTPISYSGTYQGQGQLTKT